MTQQSISLAKLAPQEEGLMVELHGGAVRVSSELGSGACFRIYFPCVENAAEKTNFSHPVFSGSNQLAVIPWKT